MINYIIKITCISLAIFCVLMEQKGRAEDSNMESIAGADRSFTYGYTQSEQVHSFERDILTREAKETAEKNPQAAPAVEEEPKHFSSSFRAKIQLAAYEPESRLSGPYN